MRKTDKSAKLNKPPKAKVEGGGIGTLKPTKEEISENRKILKHAQKLAKNKKIIKLPSGFSYDYLISFLELLFVLPVDFYLPVYLELLV